MLAKFNCLFMCLSYQQGCSHYSSNVGSSWMSLQLLGPRDDRWENFAQSANDDQSVVRKAKFEARRTWQVEVLRRSSLTKVIV